jgi:Mn2+/Fe2+ NRAMP family transporter
MTEPAIASGAQRAKWSVLLGAAFIMATSAISPGFLTQTATFTERFMANFGLRSL